jgi:SAM-dependent methyltransferase
MNPDHAALCSSPEWAQHIATTVLPAALGTVDLGTEVLEIGPGYGASTARLVASVPALTAVEIDPALADALAASYPEVTVVRGSGDALPFPDKAFSAVVCFTMLHHVHSPAAQDALFAQARRVLRDGGVFAGSDSIAGTRLHDFHADDVYVPVDPAELPERLRRAGFGDASTTVVVPEWFTFVARP